MSGGVNAVVTTRVHFAPGRGGGRRLRTGPEPEGASVPSGRVPRAARLLALAHKCEGLIASGEIADQAELARLGGVTRARVTQLLNLLHLSPEIQEAVLCLPLVERGRDPIGERDLRPIAAIVCWEEQGRMWKQLLRNLKDDRVGSDWAR